MSTIRSKHSRLARCRRSSEATPADDATELADRAATTPPEEAALTDREGVSPDAGELAVGLPPGEDLDRLEEASLDDLIEAELVAIDAGDPETAVNHRLRTRTPAHAQLTEPDAASGPGHSTSTCVPVRGRHLARSSRLSSVWLVLDPA